MLQQKILTALCSLALASSMAAPAFAADAIPLRGTVPVVRLTRQGEYVPALVQGVVDSDEGAAALRGLDDHGSQA